MAGIIERVMNGTMSRRTFLKGSLGVAALSALTLSGCQNSLGEVSTEAGGTETQTAAEEGEKTKKPAAGGSWMTAACWLDCGGKCLNKVYVEDGVIIRQKTDDTHEDTPDYPQQRSCPRGHSLRQMVLGADRLKYPMKRKNWEPGGGKKELRGADEWERISWEEALDYVADELKKAIENYGNRSILSTGFGFDAFSGVSGLIGGCLNSWTTVSYGNSCTAAYYGFGNWAAFNDRIDLRNAETVVMVGMNPAWSSPGNPSYNWKQVKEAGARFIAVDPFFNDSYAMLDAKWLPSRPATDTALFLAVAYTMITEDDPEKNPLIDWDFLYRYTVGFDAEHMPEGADPAGNFKDYVLGTADGRPKTPEWAEEICGVSADEIRNLAFELKAGKKVALLFGWSTVRSFNTDTFPQLMMTVGAMGGHIGSEGQMTAICCHNMQCGDYLIYGGGSGLPSIENPIGEYIPSYQQWTAVLDGKYDNTGNGYLGINLPREEKEVDIHLIYNCEPNCMSTWENTNAGIRAHRKVDFVVTHAFNLTANAKYADIVLPITTPWEKPGGIITPNREAVFAYGNVMEPYYECKSDQWIMTELLTRLGADPKEAYPIDEKQQTFNQFTGAQVIGEDGNFGPLVTITEEDIAEWGVEAEPQEGKISLKELLEKGAYQVERKAGDDYGYIAYKDFIDDPEANPLDTESGKFEIYCQAHAEAVNQKGYCEIQPIPTYIPPLRGYEETFSDFEKKVKGDYPFQLYNPHYLRSSHSTFQNVPWLREAFTDPLFMSAADAKEYGIEDGDTVLVTSRTGQVLRHACVSECLMPGVLGLPHGAWEDIDPATGIDAAGAENVLTESITTGQGTSGYNTQNVRLEKYTGEPIPDDVDVPQRIIEL